MARMAMAYAVMARARNSPYIVMAYMAMVYVVLAYMAMA